MSFSSLGLTPALVQAAQQKGYLSPTPIQTGVIPIALTGQDVLASAQTGSGKTAAFVLPLLQRVALHPPSAAGVRRQTAALILLPTRELAAQVAETLAAFAAHAVQAPRRIKIATVFGGVSINPQMLNLRSGADIVVATPGRLLDLIEHRALTLSAVEILVLDEADRLLDLGFGEELGRILGLLPTKRQTLFFSATFPPEARKLADSMLSRPAWIEIPAEPQTAPDIVQRAIAVDSPRRTQLLRQLAETEGWKQALVFVATKHAAEIVAEKLRKAQLKAAPFHGELSQGKRTQVLLDLKTGAVQIVIATDVAARGLDVKGLSAVVNYDLPRSAVDYTHRIGRTGRAGASGMAISFVSASTEAHFRLIEKIQGLKITREHIAGFEPIEVYTPAVGLPNADSTGGIKGIRPNKKDKLRAAGLKP